MSAQFNHRNAPSPEIVLLAVGMLWAQLFWSLIPIWQNGIYYEYGWFVGPIAIGFAIRRLAMGEFLPWKNPSWVSGIPLLALVTVFLVGTTLLVAVRIVEIVNQNWHPPLLVHALLVVGLSHGLLLVTGGLAPTRALLPVTLFALTAVPYPGQVEMRLVEGLTDAVISATTELFHLSGLPVERFGNSMSLSGLTVEVTGGCSGIKSLQTFIMAGMFFGELLLLRLPGRLFLLGVAGTCSLVLNIARAYWLAKVRFFEGEEAFDGKHDLVGHTAFALGSLILLLSGRLLSRTWGGRTVVTKHKAGQLISTQSEDC